MTKPNLALGLASAIAVIFIWSGFIVFSRAGVTTNLTPYDVAGLRFLVAGLIVLPFAYAWWPRQLSWPALAALALCGPGFVYSLLMFRGLEQASAAYGGVFANGSLPIFTAITAFLLAGDRPDRRTLIAVAVILVGGILLGLRGMTAGGADVLWGIVLFLAASAVLSVYIYGVRHWQLTPKQALVLVNIPNAVIYLPVWYFLLPSGLADTGMSVIAFQALFQGLGPGFLAVILFALAAIHLGPTPTASLAATVPATAALLAIPVLAEFSTPLEWLGIAIVTVGLAILILRR